MIDYSNLVDSQKFYKSYGFKAIEAPWIITQKVNALTMPPDRKPNLIDGEGVLVGSAEQSFLQMYYSKMLKPGKYQAITPCFRNEEILDELHHPYFMKNELIITDVVNPEMLYATIQNCMKFFKKYIPENLRLEKTEEGYDIMYKDIELGSYGIRECEFLQWIYATGCAEPRLSYAKNQYGLSHQFNTERSNRGIL